MLIEETIRDLNDEPGKREISDMSTGGVGGLKYSHQSLAKNKEMTNSIT